MKTVRLGDVTKVAAGQGAPKANEFSEDGIPFVRAGSLESLLSTGSLDGCEKLNAVTAQKRRMKLFPEGTVLFAKSGMSATKGRVFRLPRKAHVVSHLAALIPTGDYDSSYLTYWLRQNPPSNLIKDDAYPSIRLEDIANIQVPLPPIDEQKRIAAILDKADAVRKKRQQALEMLDEFLRATFLDMFGDPVTNPKGYKVVPLEELCSKITDGTHQSPKWESQGVPFIFISNVENNSISLETKKFISVQTWESLTTRSPIELGDILYTTVGSYGNVAMVRDKAKFAFQRHIAHIKPDHSKVHPEFLTTMLQQPGIKWQADKMVRGVAQKTLNLRELKSFTVFDVHRDQQEKFIGISNQVLSTRSRLDNCLFANEVLFSSLSQRAFRGEL